MECSIFYHQKKKKKKEREKKKFEGTLEYIKILA